MGLIPIYDDLFEAIYRVRYSAQHGGVSGGWMERDMVEMGNTTYNKV